jgi:hypothetical protein
MPVIMIVEAAGVALHRGFGSSDRRRPRMHSPERLTEPPACNACRRGTVLGAKPSLSPINSQRSILEYGRRIAIEGEDSTAIR